MSNRVEIFEVGPRDGLQNEARMIPVAEKVALVDLLSQAGFRRIEVASFVSPKWVPQMAGSAEVLAGITRAEGVRYAALAPNMRGFEDAVAARADEVALAQAPAAFLSAVSSWAARGREMPPERGRPDRRVRQTRRFRTEQRLATTDPEHSLVPVESTSAQGRPPAHAFPCA